MAKATTTSWALAALLCLPALSAVAQPRTLTEEQSAAEIERWGDRLRAISSIQGRYGASTFYDAVESPPRSDMAPGELDRVFAFKSPNQLSLDRREYHARCDGKVLRIYCDYGRQYVEVPAPSPEDLDSTLRYLTRNRLSLPLPIRAIVNRGVPVAEALRLARINSVEYDNDGRVVRAEVRMRDMSGTDGAAEDPAVLTIDPDTGLITEGLIDLSARRKPTREGRHSGVWFGMHEHEVGADLDESLFVFTPAALDTRVQRLWISLHWGESGPQMIGHAPPELRLKDADGRLCALADFKGRVVVLCFWSTKHYNAESNLIGFRALAEQFADTDIVFLGVAMSEEHDTADSVSNAAAASGVRFRQLVGATRDDLNRFEIPDESRILIIGADNRIHHHESPYGPRWVDSVASVVRRVHSGRDLPADEYARMMSRKNSVPAPLTDREVADVLARAKLEERNPDALVPLKDSAAAFSAFRATLFDVDGDGIQETVCPGENGRIQIFSSDSELKRSIPMQPRMESKWTSGLFPVRIGGETRFIVVGHSRDTGPTEWRREEEKTAIEIAMYDSDGVRLWTLERECNPSVHLRSSVAVGDLTGDGSPEVAALFSSSFGHRLSRTTRLTQPTYQLVVIGADGRVLAARDIEGHPLELYVFPSPAPGEPGTIAYGAFNMLTRWRLDPTMLAE